MATIWIIFICLLICAFIVVVLCIASSKFSREENPAKRLLEEIRSRKRRKE